jgi:hypothetical protein
MQKVTVCELMATGEAEKVRLLAKANAEQIDCLQKQMREQISLTGNA